MFNIYLDVVMTIYFLLIYLITIKFQKNLFVKNIPRDIEKDKLQGLDRKVQYKMLQKYGFLFTLVL